MTRNAMDPAPVRPRPCGRYSLVFAFTLAELRPPTYRKGALALALFPPMVPVGLSRPDRRPEATGHGAAAPDAELMYAPMVSPYASAAIRPLPQNTPVREGARVTELDAAAPTAKDPGSAGIGLRSLPVPVSPTVTGTVPSWDGRCRRPFRGHRPGSGNPVPAPKQPEPADRPDQQGEEMNFPHALSGMKTSASGSQEPPVQPTAVRAVGAGTHRSTPTQRPGIASPAN